MHFKVFFKNTFQTVHAFATRFCEHLFTKIKSRKEHLITGILIGCIVSVIVSSLSFLGHFRPYENKVTDLLQGIVGQKAKDVVLLFITEKEYMQGFRGISPLSRKRLAEVVETLVKLKPRVIALDIDISDHTPEDHYLLQAFENAVSDGISVIVAGRPIDMDSGDANRQNPSDDTVPYHDQRPRVTEEGLLLFRNIDSGRQWIDRVITGGVVFRLERDGVFRKAEAFYMVKNSKTASPFPSLPLAVVASFIGLDKKSLATALSKTKDDHILIHKQKNGVTDIRIPIERGGRVTPNFIGNYKKFDYVANLEEILEEYGSEKTGNHTVFQNKIVLVGGVYDVKDFYLTPVGRMSGMEILANITQSILNENLITHNSLLIAFILELILGIIVALIFTMTTSLRATFICFMTVTPAIVVASIISFSAVYHWIDFVPTVFAVFIHGWAARLETYFHGLIIKIKNFFFKHEGQS